MRLTPKEFELLAMLAKNAGRAVTHRQILLAVWGAAHVGDLLCLRVFVGQVRQKLEGSPDCPRLIVTALAIGYLLAAE